VTTWSAGIAGPVAGVPYFLLGPLSYLHPSRRCNLFLLPLHHMFSCFIALTRCLCAFLHPFRWNNTTVYGQNRFGVDRCAFVPVAPFSAPAYIWRLYRAKTRYLACLPTPVVPSARTAFLSRWRLRTLQTLRVRTPSNCCCSTLRWRGRFLHGASAVGRLEGAAGTCLPAYNTIRSPGAQQRHLTS